MDGTFLPYIIYTAMIMYNLLLIVLLYFQIKTKKMLFKGFISASIGSTLLFNLLLVQTIEIRAGGFYSVYLVTFSIVFLFCGLLYPVIFRKENDRFLAQDISVEKTDTK